MSEITLSPNMNMPVPNVSEEPGPDWAEDINASLSIIDSHTHTSGQGVPITPDAIDINADLPMNDYNLTEARTVRFYPNAAALSDPTDIGCLYEVEEDLYYNDGNGNQVRITQGGAVAGASGTITGLPSGTASASYSAPTFTWQSATNTPANMATGPIIMGRVTAGSKTVTLSPASGQPSDYNLTFPAAAPANGEILLSDGSGNFTWLGSFVATGSFTGTFTGVSGSITSTFYYAMANNIVTIQPQDGSVSFTKSGTGTFGITGAPSSILPTSSTVFTVPFISTDGGSAYQATRCNVTSSGFTIYANVGANNIPNGASCVLSGIAFTYLLRS